MTFNLETNEIYQEITLMMDGEKIGEAEVELNNKELSRLAIFEPYQNKGYGTKVVNELTKKYNLKRLWVRSDNEKAIHVYEKCGYKIKEPTMYLMESEEV